MIVMYSHYIKSIFIAHRMDIHYVDVTLYQIIHNDFNFR